jgi:hypothetical protein
MPGTQGAVIAEESDMHAGGALVSLGSGQVEHDSVGAELDVSAEEGAAVWRFVQKFRGAEQTENADDRCGKHGAGVERLVADEG